MKTKARAFLDAHSMLRQGDRVAVGFSGGADSVALLHFLSTACADLSLRLTALHVHHGIRGEEADRDEAFCRAFCEARAIDYRCERVDVPVLSVQRRQSEELCAREERYRLLRAAAGPGGRIAVAHTASDNLETVLYHLARGTGLGGLCGIPPVRPEGEALLIRPLLCCTREEIEAYCTAEGLSYVQDSTNASLDYARNRIRHRVVPELLAVHPGLWRSFSHLLEAIGPDHALLEAQAAALESTCRKNGGWEAARLCSAHPALRRRVLRRLLEHCGAAVDTRKILLLEALLEAGTGALELCADCYATVQNGYLQLCDKPLSLPAVEPLFSPQPLREGKIELTGGKNVQIARGDRAQYEQFAKTSQKPLKNVLDYAKITGTAQIRPRREGDTIRLPGRRTKPLKKLFQEQKVPLSARGATVILADEAGPLWVEGFGAAERAAVCESTREFLFLWVKSEQ